jgi:hypothetical protein
MGLLAQNPSQSAAWLKPACDWATFGKFGGSRQSTVKLPCVGPKIDSRVHIMIIEGGSYATLFCVPEVHLCT